MLNDRAPRIAPKVSPPHNISGGITSRRAPPRRAAARAWPILTGYEQQKDQPGDAGQTPVPLGQTRGHARGVAAHERDEQAA